MASWSDSIIIVYYRRQRAYNPESTPYQYVTNSLTVTAAHAEFLIKNTQNNVCKYCIQGQQVCYMLVTNHRIVTNRHKPKMLITVAMMA